jgi:uncharacterized protein involved in outer membrane biogenesis
MKLVKLIIRTLVTLTVMVSVLVGVMMIAEVSIPLDSMRQPFIDAVEESTGRDTDIDGDLRLTVSLFPALVMERLKLANESGWQDETFISLGKTRIQVSLLPLLQGELEFNEVAAEQAVINLEQRADGRKSWAVARQGVKNSANPAADSTEHMPFSDNISIRKFNLANITFTYRDEKLGRVITDHLDKFQINTHDRSRLTLKLSGDIDNIPYTVNAKSDLLRNLISGKPWNLEAEGEIGGRPVSLTGDILISDGFIDGKLDLQIIKVDIGGLLEFIDITQGLELTTGQAQIKADLKGGSLHDIVNLSNFEVALRDGQWKLGSHVDKRFQAISFQHATINSKQSQDLDMKFSGKIGHEPVDFTLQLSPLGAFIKGLDRTRFLLELKVANSDVRLDGNIKLPVSSKTLAMNVAVSGQRLDQWNHLMISDLPPYGPYKLTGNLGLTPDGFHVADFRAMIGDSDLGGTIDINMTKQRPVWTMNMVSNQLQFNDFIVEGYTLIPGKKKTPIKNVAESKIEKSAKEKERQLSQKLDQRLGETRDIDQWDIDVTVESRNNFSGKDRLGDGKIVLSARADSFDQSIHLNTPGGQIDSDMGLKLVDDEIRGHLKLDMDKFDFGILLRRIDPETKSGGLLSTRIDLRLAGKSFADRFDRASGVMDFAIWPQNISSGDIDIWAYNIFQAVSSSATNSESKINCAVGILNIEEGQLNEEFLAVDTTKVWLHGNIDINYPSETIELTLIPRPKKPKIGGIETPIYLQGNLNDNFGMSDLKVKKSEIVKTFASIILSPLHVPMRRIYGEKIPADGSEMCGNLLDRSYLKSIKDKMKEKEITLDDMYSGD